MSWSVQKVWQRTEGVLSEEKTGNVSPAEILSVASYVSFALFHWMALRDRHYIIWQNIFIHLNDGKKRLDERCLPFFFSADKQSKRRWCTTNRAYKVRQKVSSTAWYGVFLSLDGLLRDKFQDSSSFNSFIFGCVLKVPEVTQGPYDSSKMQHIRAFWQLAA